MTLRFTAIFVVSLFLAPLVIAQEEVTLESSKDNTLFEAAEGDLSNGAGEHFFVGRTATGNNRRGLLAFDVDGALPDGAIINTAVLTLHVSNVPPGAGTETITLHQLTADWGEGTSDASGAEGAGAASETGDATWIHRFFDTDLWANAGGDFEESPSATFEVDGIGTYDVSSDELTDDVRSWVGEPASNFGWILVGNESEEMTARRFDSRENGTGGDRPQLTITYISGTAAEPTNLPTTLRLTGNYPNPFAESTTIHFEVERPQHVSLTLYDVLGRAVKPLVRGHRTAGPHEIAVSSSGLPAGTYLYCFDDGGRCGRMTIIP